MVAKKLDRRLAALGATAVLERGLGDDQHPSGYEAALDPWLASLWKTLRGGCIPWPPGSRRCSRLQRLCMQSVRCLMIMSAGIKHHAGGDGHRKMRNVVTGIFARCAACA